MLERRSGSERRQRSLAAYWLGARLVRRKGGRRSSDLLYPIIDRYSLSAWTAALGIMLLCCFDAFLTIELLARGAVEANPAMALAMQAGMGWFGAIKLASTAAGVIVLVACSGGRLFRRIPGEAPLHVMLACYIVLIGYEFWLSGY